MNRIRAITLLQCGMYCLSRLWDPWYQITKQRISFTSCQWHFTLCLRYCGYRYFCRYRVYSLFTHDWYMLIHYCLITDYIITPLVNQSGVTDAFKTRTNLELLKIIFMYRFSWRVKFFFKLPNLSYLCQFDAFWAPNLFLTNMVWK